jgi:hypothetical protein
MPPQHTELLWGNAAWQAVWQGHWLQVVAGAYLRQLPLTQSSSEEHASPQLPQLSGSLLVLTQA